MGTLEIDAIRNYLLEVGCKIEYPILVNAFKQHLYNPDPNVQGKIRTRFKDYVNRLATVSLENNMKFIILRPEFRPPDQQVLAGVGQPQLAAPTVQPKTSQKPVEPASRQSPPQPKQPAAANMSQPAIIIQPMTRVQPPAPPPAQPQLQPPPVPQHQRQMNHNQQAISGAQSLTQQSPSEQHLVSRLMTNTMVTPPQTSIANNSPATNSPIVVQHKQQVQYHAPHQSQIDGQIHHDHHRDHHHHHHQQQQQHHQQLLQQPQQQKQSKPTQPLTVQQAKLSTPLSPASSHQPHFNSNQFQVSDQMAQDVQDGAKFEPMPPPLPTSVNVRRGQLMQRPESLNLSVQSSQIPPPRPPPRRRQSTASLFNKPSPKPIEKSREIHDLAKRSPGRVKEHAFKLNAFTTASDISALMPMRSSTMKENRLSRDSTMGSIASILQRNGSHATSRSRLSHREDESDSSSLQPIDPLRRKWAIEACQCNYNGLLTLLREDTKLASYKDIVNGYTALHWAAKFGNLDIIKLIAGTHSVSANIRSSAGYTPLHVAYMFNRNEAADLLIKSYKANPDVRDHSGKRPRQYWQQERPITAVK